MKTSFRKINSFFTAVKDYEVKISNEDKVFDAAKKVAERLSPVAQKLVEDIEKDKEKIRINNAKLDEDGCVMYGYEADGNRKYKFTPEGMLNCEDQIMALIDKEVEINVKPHVVANSAIPANLHDSFIDAFRGFVIEHNYKKPVKKEIVPTEE